MTERDAILAGIAASPEDDVARLIFADWCEERGGDREVATAEFIRLTCGLPVPDMVTKNIRCDKCAGVGTVHLYNGEIKGDWWRVAKCKYCDGRGKAKRSWRPQAMYPKAAHEWLLANWRRLVPALTRDWSADIVEANWKWWTERRARDPDWHPAPEQIIGRSAITPKRGRIEAVIPMIAFNRPDGSDRVYSPRVNLSFHRGFVTDASWRAPVLGEKIAALLAEDQPLARQSGPHAIPDSGDTVSPQRRA